MSWRVDSYYFNVGSGDGALHVLAQATSGTQLPSFVAAVLVDGGKKRCGSVPGGKNGQGPPKRVTFDVAPPDPITNIFEHVSTAYSFTNTADCFQLDSIVVSHWDTDHFTNLTNKIVGDIDNAEPDPITQLTKLPYLKYDTAGYAQTYLYGPTWKSRGPTFQGGARRTGLEEKVVVEKGESYLHRNGICVLILRTTDKYGSQTQGSIYNVLGTNFFNNQALEEQPIAHPSDLLAKNPPSSPPDDRPGFYCIGVMKMGFAGNDQPGIIEDQHITSTNLASIAAAIMWPSQRISHYCAGDAPQQIEMPILQWLTSEQKTVNTVKLSHHGSRSSTPISMFEMLKPLNVIVCNPSGGTNVHPGWELILYWSVWFRLNALTLRPARGLLATKFPFWLGCYPGIGPPGPDIDFPYSKWLNLEAFDKGKTVGLAFQDFLKNSTQEINAGFGVQEVDECQSFNQFSEAVEKDVELLNCWISVTASLRWDDFGFPKVGSYPAPAATSVFPIGTPVSLNDQLLFIQISAEDDEDKDGAVWYRTVGSAVPQPVPPIKQVVPIASAGASNSNANNNGTAAPWLTANIDITKDLHAGSSGGGGGAAAAAATASTTRPGLIAIVNPDQIDTVSTDPLEAEGEGKADGTTNTDVHKAQNGGGTRLSLTLLPRQIERTEQQPQNEVREVTWTAPDPAWCIYSTAVSAANIKVTNYAFAVKDSFLDSYVGSLHYSTLCLQANPQPIASPASATTIQLDSTDEWGSWLSNAVGASNVSVITTAAGDIGGYAFELTIPSDQSSETAQSMAATPFKALFSTAAIADAFNIAPPPPATDPLSAGYLNKTSLVLGLDTLTVTGALTLQELLQYINLTNRIHPLALAALGTVELSIPQGTNTATGKRNVVWFEPSKAYKTTVRLRFDMSEDAVETLSSYFTVLGGAKIVQAWVIARKRSTWSSDGSKIASLEEGDLVVGIQISVPYSVSGNNRTLTFDGAIVFSPNRIKFELIFRTRLSEALDGALQWLAGLVEVSPSFFDFTSLQNKSTGSATFGGFELRRVTLELTYDVTNTLKPQAFRVDMELGLNLTNDDALFMISYRYADGQGSILEGNLWNKPDYDPSDPQVAAMLALQPEYEDYEFIAPVTVTDWTKWKNTLDLASIGGFVNLPKEIPTQVFQVSLRASNNGFGFSGKLICDQPPAGNVPSIWLGCVDVSATYAWGMSGTSKFDGSFSMTAMISPPENSQVALPSQIIGSIDYESDPGTWSLNAWTANLSGATLLQFFDADTRNAAALLIESIEIDVLDVTYTYGKESASSFVLDGNFKLGDFELELIVNNNGGGFQFSAQLSLENTPAKTTTIGGILIGLAGSNFQLPSFIADVQVDIPSTPNDVGLEMVSIAATSTQEASVLLTAWVDVLGFSFQYVQFYRVSDSKQPKPPYKRLFFASVASLPDNIDIPLIGSIRQPFDQALFAWVQPQDEWEGFNKDDLDLINAELVKQNRKTLPYKQNGPTNSKTDVLIRTGLHFMITKSTSNGSEVIVDYVFGGKDPPPSQRSLRTFVSDDKDSRSSNNGSAMAPYQKVIGPLTIRNIGFAYSGGQLSIKFDASVTLGPVAFDLIGFALVLDFSKGGTLKQLPDIHIGLDGLGAVFDKPPVEFAGVLAHVVTDQVNSYQGAASLTFDPWGFQAAGYYGQITPKNEDPYSSAYMYFILNGPLLTLEFATITNVVGGFGYNTNLRFPTASNVPQFPLISGGNGAAPKDAMANLTDSGWFSNQKDMFWVAAGLAVTAFEILRVQAVVVVEWNEKVMLGIFGLATLDVPKGVKPSEVFAHVQLGIVATVDFDAGILKVEGQLTPESYVLAPACHLTGGFALYDWFDSSDPLLKGDWVFTIGGYHQSFTPPPQYPTPPRLAISWKYDDEISISGEAYFAITPKVCMGGGRLDVSMAAGPLGASFDAHADFLIQFKPFYFIADGGVSVGVIYDLDLLFTTKRISISLGATLHLEGPPLHGNVHVNFFIFGFDIGFGSPGSSNSDPIDLETFYELACQAQDDSQALAKKFAGTLSKSRGSPSLQLPADGLATTANDVVVPHVFTPLTGLIPSNNAESTPSTGDWHVRGAVFAFQVSCKVVIGNGVVVTQDVDGNEKAQSQISGSPTPIWAKPMHLDDSTGPLSSKLTVSIKPDVPSKAQLSKGDPPIIIPPWANNQGIFKNVPTGLWAKYDASTDPTNPSANTSSLLDGNNDKSVSQLTGVRIAAPLPQLSRDTLAATNADLNITDVPDAKAYPVLQPAAAALLPEPPDTSAPGKQFQDVVDAWSNPVLDPAGFVAAWPFAQLGWPAGALVADKPTKLLDNFDQEYLWAPLLANKAIPSAT